MKSAREDLDQGLSRPEGFEKWFVDSATISLSEAYGPQNTVPK